MTSITALRKAYSRFSRGEAILPGVVMDRLATGKPLSMRSSNRQPVSAPRFAVWIPFFAAHGLAMTVLPLLMSRTG